MLDNRQMNLVATQIDKASVFIMDNPNQDEARHEIKQTVFLQMCKYEREDGEPLTDVHLADTVRSKLRTETSRSAKRFGKLSPIAQLPEHWEPCAESDPVEFSKPSARKIAAMREWCDIHSQVLEDTPTRIAMIRDEIERETAWSANYQRDAVDIALNHYAKTGNYVDPRTLAESFAELQIA